MKESEFQSKLIKEIKSRFPGCVVMKTDPNYIQGIPDLLILYENKWAMLEVKANATAARRPNQDWYVNKLNGMSFSAFVYPENRKEILDEMEQSFKS
mgnify:CR=1 FL=1